MALREIDGGPGYFSQFTNSLPSDPNFFPIGVWFESVTSQSDINLDKAAGLNLYVVLTANSNLTLIQSNGMYAILQGDNNDWRTNQAAIDNPAVVGWLLTDEIDMQQSNAAGAAIARSQLNSTIASLPSDGRFHYSNYSKGVTFWNSDSDAEQYVNDFQDVTSADIYWFTDSDLSVASQGGELLNNGNPLTLEQTRLAANYGYTVDRMRYLDGLDGQRQPIWTFVEVGWPFTETAAQGGRQILPEEIQAAVWHSLIAGARGIVYFNHSFGGPHDSQHVLRDPDYAEERAAVTETNALIEQLAPVLNAPFDDGFVSINSSVRAAAHYYQGEHYVFAGATVNGAATGPDIFTLAGITSGTAVVIGENRTITITNGQFSDTFADGNAIHIYQINTGGIPTPGTISINDVTISEGNSGTKVATFTVTRSGGTAAFDVNFATSNATATVADSDFVAASNTLHFAANQNTATISVTINGDTKVEANETFNVVLSNATSGAIISDSQGVGTITNDDGGDTAVYSQGLGSYSVQDLGTRIVISGPDGTDTLTSVEHLRFADGTVHVDDGNPLFDTLFYMRNNLDVFHAGVGALAHYNAGGWHEGRNPNPFFDSSWYLAVNTDVRAVGTNPLEHYQTVGWREGRDPSPNFDTKLYLMHNPDVAGAAMDPLLHFLANGQAEGRVAYAAIGQPVSGFDAQYYLAHNPDVAAAGVDALQHFQIFGWREGRNPNALFDTNGYQATYGDVAAAGINPLDHYHLFGWREGRDPSIGFDTTSYRAAYPDVAAAGVDPLVHYLTFGVYEGRSTFADGVWG